MKVSFMLTEEQEMWLRTVHDFVDREITREYIRACDIERRYPYEAYAKVAAHGYLGLVVPEAYGGVGADTMTYVLFMEAISTYGYDFGAAFSIPTFTVQTLVDFGTEEQKRQYLPAFVEGKTRFSISITEPDAGSDASNVATHAELRGDHFIVNGHKMFSSAAHAENNIMCVLVRTDPNKPKREGLSVLLIPNDLPGVELRRLPTLSRRATGTNEVYFSDVLVPRENLVGPLNGGWNVIVHHLAKERVAIAGTYIGNALGAVRDAVRYAKERVQFDRPIGKFQTIKHMLAQMHAQVETARLMVYRAAALVDAGRDAVAEACMAKLMASEALYQAATDGMQILGGYAQLPEFDMERYWRDAKQALVGGGSSQIQRELIARTLGL